MILYADTSLLLKLVLDDETGSDVAERVWVAADRVVCAQIGYAEGRAALAGATRAGRIHEEAYAPTRVEFEALWSQLDTVPVSAELVQRAGDLAESEGLRGHDAVHLGAAIAVGATVMAAADDTLLAAADRQGMATVNPLDPPGAR